MSAEDPQFTFPRKIEHYLAALSKLYAQEGKRVLQEIIVNSRPHVKLWNTDNWNGGTYGHAVFLTVPEETYLRFARNRNDVQNEIKEDINKIHNLPEEYVDQVFLEMAEIKDRDWRAESGVLFSDERAAAPTAAKRIWGEGTYRLFLSHKTAVKRETSELKKRLEPFGISCFVAHEDILPTKEWQDEIENALLSMDAFVALMTSDFHESQWTDQEVGFALARGVPVVAIKLGLDPYGFLGKFQALSCTWEEAPLRLAKLLIRQPRMLDAYIATLPRCSSFDDGNTLAQVLPHIESLTPTQVERVIAAFNGNIELRGSFGFNGAKPRAYGDGLAEHLSRITGTRYG